MFVCLKTLLRGRFVFLGLVWLGLLSLLNGCAPLADAVSSLGPAGEALSYAVKPAAAPNSARLPAGFEYLQVGVGSRQALMVLGQRRAANAAGAPRQSEDEFWYSAQSELLHLRDGRLWRVLGMTTEWRGQHSQPPAWSDVPDNGEALVWSRQVDRMPGYRWAEVEQVSTRRLLAAPADKAARAAVQGWPQAQWFEDDVQATDAGGRLWPHTQRFALWLGQVVYSEQCIARDLCLALTRLGRVQ